MGEGELALCSSSTYLSRNVAGCVASRASKDPHAPRQGASRRLLVVFQSRPDKQFWAGGGEEGAGAGCGRWLHALAGYG